MMSTTHIVIGISSALAVFRPHSVESLLPILAGASIGSIICDIDCRPKSKMRDVLTGRLCVLALLAVILVVDYEIGQPVLNYVNDLSPGTLIALFAFIICIGVARLSKHRGFSHSLLAMGIYIGCLHVMIKAVAGPFLIGFIMHLALDLTNRKPVKLFWPIGKGACLRWFYADRKANAVLMIAGAIWIGVELYCLGLINKLPVFL